MIFSQFLFILLMCYFVYYAVMILFDFFKNNGRLSAGTTNKSPHAVTFEIPQQPVNVASIAKAIEQNKFQDIREDYFSDSQVKEFKKGSSTIVADLGLEILSNGIDISAENLAILLS